MTTKILNEQYIKLLKKENLEDNEIIEIIYYTIEYCESLETGMLPTTIDVIDTNNIKASQIGFVLERTGEFKHLITLNLRHLRELTRSELIKIGINSYGNIIEANKIANKLDFKSNEDLRTYVKSRELTDEEREILESKVDEYSDFTYNTLLSYLKEYIDEEELSIVVIDQNVLSLRKRIQS